MNINATSRLRKASQTSTYPIVVKKLRTFGCWGPVSEQTRTYACIYGALLVGSDASVCMVTSSLNSPHVPALEVECAVFQDAHLKDPSGVWLTLCYKGVVSRVGKPRCCNSMLIVILTIIVCDKTCRRHWLCQHEHQRWLSRAPAGSVARTRCSAAFSSLQITACIRRCR